MSFRNHARRAVLLTLVASAFGCANDVGGATQGESNALTTKYPDAVATAWVMEESVEGVLELYDGTPVAYLSFDVAGGDGTVTLAGGAPSEHVIGSDAGGVTPDLESLNRALYQQWFENAAPSQEPTADDIGAATEAQTFCRPSSSCRPGCLQCAIYSTRIWFCRC